MSAKLIENFPEAYRRGKKSTPLPASRIVALHKKPHLGSQSTNVGRVKVRKDKNPHSLSVKHQRLERPMVLLRNPTLLIFALIFGIGACGENTSSTDSENTSPNTDTGLTSSTPTSTSTSTPSETSNNTNTQTVTATIYADNYFELFVNGTQVFVDPLKFTPHQAVQVIFEIPKDTQPVYGILASDFATDSGYEYTQTSSPQLGDGGLIATFSDGTITQKNWKCHTVLYGPTTDSEAAGCSANNLTACKVTDFGIPDNWAAVDFDDSGWYPAVEHTAEAVGWGRTPNYLNGQCCTITDPLTRENASPACETMDASQCLAPASLTFGSASFIWGADLERVNTLLCRSP